MPDWSIPPFILITCFIPGWLYLSPHLAESGEPSVVSFQPSAISHRGGKWFACLTFGICLVGWLAFLLAELSLFSLTTLAILWLLLTLGGLLYRTRFAPSPSPFASPSSLLPLRFPLFVSLLWLLIAVWLFFRPHEFVFGGADAGVYMNLAAHIAQQGSIVFEEELLVELGENRRAFLQPIEPSVVEYTLFPAFYVTDEEQGGITPQFFHLYPTWGAVGFSLAGSPMSGLRAALWLNGLWALLGVWAFYCMVRLITGWETAVLALFALSINAITVWFARYPITETLTLYLLWAGLWSLANWLEEDHPPAWGFVAGLALGQVFLTRIDFFFVLPVFALFALVQWAGGWRWRYLWFWAPLTLMVAHSLIHAMWQSWPYFYDLFGFALLLVQSNWWLPVVGGLGGVGVLVIIGRFRSHLTTLTRYRRPLLAVVVAGLLLAAVYSWWIRPYTATGFVWLDNFSQTAITFTDQENLLRLGWYLSPLGVWLGVVGVCGLVWHVERKTAVLLAITLLFSIIYLWSIRANPHQIYAMRRYMPATVPLFIMGVAWVIQWLAKWRKPWGTAVAGLLALLWLVGIGWNARGFVQQRDYQGILPQLEALNSQLDPHSILIFDDQQPVGLGYFFGTPLKFTFGHDVLVLRNPDLLDAPTLVNLLQEWHNNGRTVYWVGDTSWPAQQGFSLQTTAYTLTATYLENSYDHKPTAVLPATWQLQMAKLGESEQ